MPALVESALWKKFTCGVISHRSWVIGPVHRCSSPKARTPRYPCPGALGEAYRENENPCGWFIFGLKGFLETGILFFQCRNKGPRASFPRCLKCKTIGRTVFHRMIGLLSLLGGSLVLFQDCSTEKDAFLNRAFHQTTTRYNGYYHAKRSYKKGLEQLKKETEENYDSLLPVFVYGTEESANSMLPKMNRTIEKCSKVINKHSMDIRGKQRNRWIDDSYLLMGKAHFYKREYDKAEKMFKYVSKKFENNPIRFRAIMWLARTEMERGNRDRSGSLLKLVEDKMEELEEEQKEEYHEVYADHLIRGRKYKTAAEHLEKALEMKSWLWDQQRRTRLTFILAQLYKRMGKIDRSNRSFAKVTNMNPSYEMEFYAKIKRALSYDATVRNAGNIKEELQDMLEDPKNEEYFDRIHYALAQVALKEGDTKRAKSHLKASAQASKGNEEQKAQSYLLLADLFFEDRKYVPAQAYYDSTAMFLGEDHPRRNEVRTRTRSLGELVKYLETYERQDSLQRIASMDEAKRKAFIREQIEKAKEEARKKREEKAKEKNTPSGQPGAQQGGQGNWKQTVGGGKWYFYNAQARSVGFNEFKKRFGDRPLQDNWRILTRKTSITAQEEDEKGAGPDNKGQKGKKVPTNMKYYTKDLPLTKKAMRASIEKESGALYKAGLIYKEDLDDPAMAEKTFKKLLEEADSTSYTPNTYYQLYRMNLKKGSGEEKDNAREEKGAEYYKQRILTDYPDSKFARLIRDPKALERSGERRKKRKKAYARAFEQYKRGRYDKVLMGVDTLLQGKGADSLHPKSLLLKALVVGEKGEKDRMKRLLDSVAMGYEGTPEGKRADRLLAHLNKKTNKGGEKVRKGAKKYAYEEDTQHFFVTIFSMASGKLQKMKSTLSDFNDSYFPSRNLSVKSTLLGSDKNIVIVKDFENGKNAMNYYKTFKKNSKIMKENTFEGDFFVISSRNFSLLFQKEELESYQEFFQKRYLK